MKVFFMGPSTTAAQNANAYRKIIQTVEACGHTPALPFDLANMQEEAGEGSMSRRNLEALAQADAVILDATHKAVFGVGYFATIAVQLGKPLLLLVREGSLQGSAMNGLIHPLVTRKELSEQTAQDVVREFLGQWEKES